MDSGSEVTVRCDDGSSDGSSDGTYQLLGDSVVTCNADTTYTFNTPPRCQLIRKWDSFR